MSKRPCPFDENYAPQLKKHISNAEINKQDDNYKREQQNKTIQMLYDGMSKHLANKQKPQEFVTTTCPSCKGPPDFVSQCWFCEISLCKSCERICSFCCDKFCSQCSVPIYKNGNNFTCLTCYK